MQQGVGQALQPGGGTATVRVHCGPGDAGPAAAIPGGATPIGDTPAGAIPGGFGVMG